MDEARLSRLRGELTKARRKRDEWEAKVKDLERRYKEAENTCIHEMVHTPVQGSGKHLHPRDGACREPVAGAAGGTDPCCFRRDDPRCGCTSGISGVQIR